MLHGMNFCGVSEQFGASEMPQRKLPTLDPTWWFDGELPGLSDADVEGTIQAAFNTWSKVCAISWTKAASKASATLSIITTRIDGPLMVLADCQLPSPGLNQLLMRLDIEKFTRSFTPERGYIGLPHVLAHEVGHAMGLMHLPDDDTPDLMNARYNPAIWEPQQEEGSLTKKLYGAPRNIPVPSTPHKPVRVTVEQDGKKWSGEIPRTV